METLVKDTIVVMHNLKLLIENDFSLSWEKDHFELILRKTQASFASDSINDVLAQADKYLTDRKPQPEEVWISKKTGASVFEEPSDPDSYLKFYASKVAIAEAAFSESADMVREDRDSH